MSRADYHREHATRAEAEARRLLAERQALGGRWLAWVAGELYRLGPPQYAAMVRRELERLNGDARGARPVYAVGAPAHAWAGGATNAGMPALPVHEVTVMSKGLNAHKEGKKKPLKTAHEKRMAKKQKKSGNALLGSHGQTS